MVDTVDSKSTAFGCGGSSPPEATNSRNSNKYSLVTVNNKILRGHKKHMIIKVMTYNLHKGKNLFGRRYDMDRLKSILDQESCDIGLFQEVLGTHKLDKKIIAQNHRLTDDNWEGRTFAKNSIVKGFEHGNSIVSKKPILEEKVVDLTLNRLEKRSALLSLIDLGKIKIQCICTHLNLRKSDRKKQTLMLIDFVKENEIQGVPIIIGGDFNDSDGEITNLLIKKGGFSFIESKYKELTFPSFMPFLPLDRVLVKNLKVIESKAGSSKKYRSYSDHLPLFYKLEVNDL